MSKQNSNLTLHEYLMSVSDSDIKYIYEKAELYYATGEIEEDSIIRDLAEEYYHKDLPVERILVCGDVYREVCRRFVDFT